MSGTERRGSAYRCRRCAPRSRPESVLTHTVTHTGNERTEAVEQTDYDLILFGQKAPQSLIQQGLEGSTAVGEELVSKVIRCIDDCEVVVEE